MKQGACPLCGRVDNVEGFQAPSQLNKEFVALVNKDHPGWQVNTPVCPECFQKYHSRSLASEWSRFTRFERDLVRRITGRLTATRDTNVAFDETLTFGQRVADRVAQFGGSWTFMFLFAGVLAGWVALNSVILIRTPKGAFDPYPYILLNLFLSMLAAIQAPVIMMSQNRQSAKDRLDASHDYEVNLKAELEIQQLHLKMDDLREEQWRKLVGMQREQIEFLTSIATHLGCAVEALSHERERDAEEGKG
ncbi:MAG TPA: DUF1003 domain-containing protein [Acidobacteriota bacterium]|jgi:uncharacterized membrane protein